MNLGEVLVLFGIVLEGVRVRVRVRCVGLGLVGLGFIALILGR